MAGKGILTIKVAGDDSQFRKSMKSTEAGLMSFAKKAIGAYAGFAIAKAAAGWMMEAADAATKDAQAQAVLEKVVRANTGATKAQLGVLNDWVSTTQEQYGITEEQLRPAMQKLTAATKDVAKAQADSNLAMDVARGTGKEYTAIVDAMVKAENGSVTGLQRLGIAVKDAYGKTKDLATIMRDLGTSYGGAALEWAKSIAGRMERLKLTLGEAKEALGAGFMPILEAALPYVQEFAKWVGNLAESFASTAKAKGMGAAIGELLKNGIKGVADWFGAGGAQMIGSGIAKFIGVALTDILPALAEGAANLVKGLALGIADAVVEAWEAERRESRKREIDMAVRAGRSQGMAYADVIESRIGSEIRVNVGGKGRQGRTVGAGEYSAEEAAADIERWDKEVAAGLSALYAGMGEGMGRLAADTARGTGALGDFSQTAQQAAEATLYWSNMMSGVETNLSNLQGRTDALAQEFANMIDPSDIWTKAKGSLKSYHAEIKKQLAAARADAKAFSDVQTWFPDIPPATWAKVASMPGFAAALKKEGMDAAREDVMAITEIMAAGGDPAAQAFIDSFGKPKVTVKVETTGLSDAWQGIKDYFAGKHINIDTNIGGYGGTTGWANGGIADRPMVKLIGEDGPEAVVPLGAGKSAQREKVMQEAGLSGGGGDTYNITIDGSTIRDWDTFLSSVQAAKRMTA